MYMIFSASRAVN